MLPSGGYSIFESMQYSAGFALLKSDLASLGRIILVHTAGNNLNGSSGRSLLILQSSKPVLSSMFQRIDIILQFYRYRSVAC